MMKYSLFNSENVGDKGLLSSPSPPPLVDRRRAPSLDSTPPPKWPVLCRVGR